MLQQAPSTQWIPLLALTLLFIVPAGGNGADHRARPEPFAVEEPAQHSSSLDSPPAADRVLSEESGWGTSVRGIPSVGVEEAIGELKKLAQEFSAKEKAEGTGLSAFQRTAATVWHIPPSRWPFLGHSA